MKEKLKQISEGRTSLGIEFGSTRIKAVLVGEDFAPLAQGSHSWENRLENGIWTYTIDDMIQGLQKCFADLMADVKGKYGIPLETTGSMGISAMMHGYLAFDKNDELLTPFRTWRNTITAEAAEKLSAAFGFNIPQRWSIAHLYQAILNREPHVGQIRYINTLAGYIHKRLTGEFAIGAGDASGMFPIAEGGYNKEYMRIFREMIQDDESAKGIALADILPRIVPVGKCAGHLTEEGARLLDPTGTFKAGVPLCPPEGDAQTGMAATNAVRPLTGNISAGTSIFAMLVLDKPMKGYYPEIDVVNTPDGSPVAMIHCNNCCGELDEWVRIFGEAARLFGAAPTTDELYEKLYLCARDALSADGITAYNFISGEPVAGVEIGHPMYLREPDTHLTLGGFMKTQLYSAIACIRMGLDLLKEKEGIVPGGFTGHGGLFKVKGAASQITADALRTAVTTMPTAGEGGAWGMALLAAFMQSGDSELADFLEEKVFSDVQKSTDTFDEDRAVSCDRFMDRYKEYLYLERSVPNA